LAVLLMAVGIYSAVTAAVLRRIHEIGIRVALGAEHRQLLSQMLGRSLYPVATGLAVGVVAAVGLTRIAEGFITGLVVGPSSTYVVVAIVVVATALAAAWKPASRAAQANPVEVLHRE
ncbi:MAG: FtsX-like permease family protein, partial [Acidobacteriota bacterium]